MFSHKITIPLCLLAASALAGCGAAMHHRDGMNAMERHDYVVAVHELSQATEQDPKDLGYRRDWLRAREAATDKLLAAAAAARVDGKTADAEANYRAVLKIDRENARALAGLEAMAEAARAVVDAAKAREAFKRGELSLAAELAARVMKALPDNAEARAVRRDLDALQAQDMMASPSLSAVYKKPINLEFRDSSLKFVFDALSRTTSINFIFDRDVKVDQRTTLTLKQTTLDDAIDVILSTSQLEKKILNASSVLIYPSTAAKHKEYQDLMVKAFYLANAEAKQTASMLRTVLKLKDIFVDDKYNMLVLRENPETIALAGKLIALHDLEEPEVMLEVEVLEINRSRLLNLGVQWTSQFTVSPLGGTSSNSGSGSNGSGTGGAVMKLSDLKALTSSGIGVTVPSATINLTKTDGDTNLLANPRIRVRDREKAKILIGDKVPVVTTTSNGNFVSENIQYLDVGLKLEVEPDIHLRDEIGLKLSLEVSSLVSAIKTSNGSQAYQIGTRNFSSVLRLKDGETQILGGLINDEDRSSASRIPLVGDLPILGRLFGSQNDQRQKTEIVLSITPHLVRNIQRKDAAAEAFWSGTESNLNSKPLRLRTFDGGGQPGGAPAAGPGKAAPEKAGRAPAAAAPDAPMMIWEGPAKVAKGETFKLNLAMTSLDALRAASMQLAFDPTEFEIVSIEDGGYFAKDGKGSFSKSVDQAGGRASVGASAADSTGNKGTGRLMSITVKALAGGQDGEISLISMMPIGAQRAISRPSLPLVHRVTVAP
jgi:general secretion pathway protein D